MIILMYPKTHITLVKYWRTRVLASLRNVILIKLGLLVFICVCILLRVNEITQNRYIT